MKKELETLKNAIAGVNKLLQGDKPNEVVFEVEDIIKTLTLPNGDKVDRLIFATQDLKQFHWIKANRVVKEESAIIEELAGSLERNGNLVPVVVNEKREVIDGQRRITAKKTHGVTQPLKYFFDRDAKIEEVRESNRYNDKWKHKDWLHSYVESDYEDYKEYEELAKKYEPVMKSRSLRSVLMNNRVESFKRDIWEGGKFKINKKSLAENIRFLSFLEQVCNLGGAQNVFAKNRDFQKVLYELYTRTPNLDEERLLAKISYGFGKLNIKTDEKTYRKVLTQLYNTRLSGDRPKMSPAEPTEVSQREKEKV